MTYWKSITPSGNSGAMFQTQLLSESVTLIDSNTLVLGM